MHPAGKAMSEALMSHQELQDITGGYSQAAKQLEELHRQGFWRARRSRLHGAVILERAHYEAVCAGRDLRAVADTGSRLPQLRPA